MKRSVAIKCSCAINGGNMHTQIKKRTLIQLDQDLLKLVQKMRNFKWDAVMVFVTSLGDAGFVWIAIGVVMSFKQKARKTVMALFTSLISGLAIGNLYLKNLVARPRPFSMEDSKALLIATPSDWSFPSGHTLAGFEVATVLYRYNKLLGIATYALASLIAYSRMYLNLHYPSDVLYAALLGLGISTLVYKIMFKDDM